MKKIKIFFLILMVIISIAAPKETKANIDQLPDITTDNIAKPLENK